VSSYNKIVDLVLILSGIYSSILLKIRPGIRILMYHRISKMHKYDQLCVDPELFDMQMAFLNENYNVISIEQAIEKLSTGKYSGNEVVITFDDGYMDNYMQALPILEKYDFPASIYITTEFTDQVKSHPRYNEAALSLHLSWTNVCELLNHNITIGAHTVSHPYLQQISPDDCKNEILNSKLEIENKINRNVDVFCYPSGDYAERELSFIKESGFMAALTVSPGVNRKSTSLLELKRTEVTNKDNSKYFFKKLSGAFDPLHLILDIKRKYLFAKKRYSNT
jgi:peptidoglycan/xylan/chitin deacetylase (PgdA/CDA1 family)